MIRILRCCACVRLMDASAPCSSLVPAREFRRWLTEKDKSENKPQESRTAAEFALLGMPAHNAQHDARSQVEMAS